MKELVGRGEGVKAASRSGRPFEGAEGIRFDFADPATWEPAFEGVDRVYLMLPMGFPEAERVQRELIDLAAARKVKIVLQTSIESGDDPDGEQGRVERYLAAKGVPFAILRPGWFMDNFHIFWLEEIKRGDLSMSAGDGKVAFIDARDIADSAAAVLTSDAFDGGAYDLTGPEELSYAETAAILSEALGRTVTYTAIPASDYVSMLISAGMPKEHAEFFSQALSEATRNAASKVTGDVERLTGHAPRSFRQFARDKAARYAG